MQSYKIVIYTPNFFDVNNFTKDGCFTFVAKHFMA